LQLAKTGCVDRSEWRAGRSKRLRVDDAACGAEDTQELVALTADAAEHAELLKNHGPGNNGEKKKQSQNTTRNQSCVAQDASEINQKKTSNQKNTSSPQL
jgi:hypothetical protein